MAAIHDLKEKLKTENDNLKKIKHKLKELQEQQKAEKEEAKSQTSFLKGNAELRHKIEVRIVWIFLIKTLWKARSF